MDVDAATVLAVNGARNRLVDTFTLKFIVSVDAAAAVDG